MLLLLQGLLLFLRMAQAFLPQSSIQLFLLFENDRQKKDNNPQIKKMNSQNKPT